MVGIEKEIGKWVLFTQWMLKCWSVRYPHLKLQFGFIRNLYTWNSSHLNVTQKYEDVKGTAQGIDKYMKRFCACQKNNLTSVEWERVDLNGLGGELLIRTKQKYLTECNWIKMILQIFLEASATIRDVKEKQKILETILFPLFSFSHCSGNTVSLRSD